MPDLTEFFHRYGSIVFGLMIGAITHIGRLLGESSIPSIQHLLGYVMQLGMIGLVAVVATKFLGVEDADVRALVTAILAVSAQEVVTAIRRMGWRGLLRGALRGVGLRVEDIDDKKG